MNSLPQGPFDVILADPPWQYSQRKPPKEGLAFRSSTRVESAGLVGCAIAHYATMSPEELAALPVASRAADTGCLLAMCTTYPKIVDGSALRLIEAWGFVPRAGFGLRKTCKDGVRSRAGMGYWTRGVIEHVLLATRGPVRVPPRGPACQPGIVGDSLEDGPFVDLPEFLELVLHSPRGRHSEKPDAIREFLEVMTEHVGDRRLEMFARRRVPGWECWGTLEYEEVDPLG